MRRLYSGACHCGAVRFEIDAEIDHVRACDCSVCAKRAALIFRVPADAFRLLTAWDALSVYRWGSMTGAGYFCTICGVLPFRQPSRPTAEEAAAGVEPFLGWAVNTRCLEGFDPASVPRKHIHGRTLAIQAG